MGKAEEFAALAYQLSQAVGDAEKMQIAARNMMLFIAENFAEIESALRESEEREIEKMSIAFAGRLSDG
jgi:hypothetical protein